MAKICAACGAELYESLRPANKPEDCPECGGIDTAKEGPAEDEELEK